MSEKEKIARRIARRLLKHFDIQFVEEGAGPWAPAVTVEDLVQEILRNLR